jgi:hypothetical protein
VQQALDTFTDSVQGAQKMLAPALESTSQALTSTVDTLASIPSRIASGVTAITQGFDVTGSVGRLKPGERYTLGFDLAGGIGAPALQGGFMTTVERSSQVYGTTAQDSVIDDHYTLRGSYSFGGGTMVGLGTNLLGMQALAIASAMQNAELTYELKAETREEAQQGARALLPGFPSKENVKFGLEHLQAIEVSYGGDAAGLAQLGIGVGPVTVSGVAGTLGGSARILLRVEDGDPPQLVVGSTTQGTVAASALLGSLGQKTAAWSGIGGGATAAVTYREEQRYDLPEGQPLASLLNTLLAGKMKLGEPKSTATVSALLDSKMPGIGNSGGQQVSIEVSNAESGTVEDVKRVAMQLINGDPMTCEDQLTAKMSARTVSSSGLEVSPGGMGGSNTVAAMGGLNAMASVIAKTESKGEPIWSVEEPAVDAFPKFARFLWGKATPADGLLDAHWGKVPADEALRQGLKAGTITADNLVRWVIRGQLEPARVRRLIDEGAVTQGAWAGSLEKLANFSVVSGEVINALSKESLITPEGYAEALALAANPGKSVELLPDVERSWLEKELTNGAMVLLDANHEPLTAEQLFAQQGLKIRGEDIDGDGRLDHTQILDADQKPVGYAIRVEPMESPEVLAASMDAGELALTRMDGSTLALSELYGRFNAGTLRFLPVSDTRAFIYDVEQKQILGRMFVPNTAAHPAEQSS